MGGETDIHLPLVHSPDGYSASAGLELGAFSRSHVSAEAQRVGPFSTVFPGTLVGNWIRSGAAGARAGAHMGCWHHRWMASLVRHSTSPMWSVI